MSAAQTRQKWRKNAVYKDRGARWTQNNNETHRDTKLGSIDNPHKIIRDYGVTDERVYDSPVCSDNFANNTDSDAKVFFNKRLTTGKQYGD